MFAFAQTILLFLLLICRMKYCKAVWFPKELELVEKLSTTKNTSGDKVVQCLQKSDYTSVTTENEQGFAVLKNTLPQDFNEDYKSVFLYGKSLDVNPEKNQRILIKFKNVLFLKTTILANMEKVMGDQYLTFSNGKSGDDVKAKGYTTNAARPMGRFSKYVMVDIGEPTLLKFLDSNNACAITSNEGVQFKIANVTHDAQESSGEGSILSTANIYFLLTPIDNPNPKAVAI